MLLISDFYLRVKFCVVWFTKMAEYLFLLLFHPIHFRTFIKFSWNIWKEHHFHLPFTFQTWPAPPPGLPISMHVTFTSLTIEIIDTREFLSQPYYFFSHFLHVYIKYTLISYIFVTYFTSIVTLNPDPINSQLNECLSPWVFLLSVSVFHFIFPHSQSST